MTGISMVDLVMMTTGRQQGLDTHTLTITNVRIGEVIVRHISTVVGITGDHHSQAMVGTTITKVGATRTDTPPQEVSGHMASVVASRQVRTIMAAVETHMATILIEAVGAVIAINMADIPLLILRMETATAVKVRLEEGALIRFITTTAGELVDKLVTICCAFYMLLCCVNYLPITFS